MQAKDKVFDFFRRNPQALKDKDNKKYAEQLGVTSSTYKNYKGQYKSLYLNKEIPEWERYYKGRLRQKFVFDDSKL